MDSQIGFRIDIMEQRMDKLVKSVDAAVSNKVSKAVKEVSVGSGLEKRIADIEDGIFQRDRLGEEAK
eukprot:12419181-Karenia_brevis.AAC.1